MAASSASDSVLTAKEVSLWFPDAEQKNQFMGLWVDATIFTGQYAPDEWAHVSWRAVCDSLREMQDDFDFAVLTLEKYILQMKERPPRETHARPKMAKRQKLGTTNFAHQCEPAAVAAEAQPLAAAQHAAPGADVVAASAACDQNETNLSPESSHDHSQQHPSSRDLGGKQSIATATLTQARRTRLRKPGKQFTDRQEKFRALLIEMTSSLQAIKTRKVYARFREI